MINVPIVGGRLRSQRCLVMGILNVTPDSFSDGGDLLRAQALDERIKTMLAGGADILDVGGESTRPGHALVSVDAELARIIPAIQAIRRIDSEIPISIDTSKAAVARAALGVGASMVNDVSGLGDEKMAGVVADAGCAIVLMRHATIAGDVVAGCHRQLQTIVAGAETAGIKSDAIIVDPGLGFGEIPGASAEHNLLLVDNIQDYADGLPVLIGGSRKRFIGDMMGESDPRQRLSGSLQVAKRAQMAGAAIVRVHDVVETVAALQYTD